MLQLTSQTASRRGTSGADGRSRSASRPGHILWWLTLLWCPLIVSATEQGEATSERPARVDVYSQDVGHFEQLLESELPEQRLEGVQGLSHLKHWPAEAKLIERLTDPSSEVRQAALAALCRLGSSRSIPLFIQRLDDRTWHTRGQVHLALCRLTAQTLPCQRDPWENWWNAGTPESREQELLSGLAADSGNTTQAPRRLAALRALSHTATAAAEPVLRNLLAARQEPPLEVQEQVFALEALERVGTSETIPVLARYRRDAAVWALGRIGGPQAEAALWEFPATLPVLMNLDRLHSTRGRPIVPELVRRMGLVTFRSQPDDLYAPPTPIQRVAANLILRSGAAPELIDAILNELEATRGQTPQSPPQPPDYLRELMERFREELRPGFVRNDGVTTSQPLTALYHIAEDPSIVPRLRPLLRHPAFVPRIYVAMTLAKLKATEAVPDMLALVDEGYPFSDAATLVSGKHGEYSQSVRWRGFICMALGRLGGDQARQALEAYAADPQQYRDIRYGAVVGLGLLGSPASLPVLQQVAQQDTVWMVREAARAAQAEIELLARMDAP